LAPEKADRREDVAPRGRAQQDQRNARRGKHHDFHRAHELLVANAAQEQRHAERHVILNRHAEEDEREEPAPIGAERRGIGAGERL
jgi:hypothetical protein